MTEMAVPGTLSRDHFGGRAWPHESHYLVQRTKHNGYGKAPSTVPVGGYMQDCANFSVTLDRSPMLSVPLAGHVYNENFTHNS